MLRFALFELLLIASPFAVWLIWRALSDMRAAEAEAPAARAMPVGLLFMAGAALAVAGAVIAALVTSGQGEVGYYGPAQLEDGRVTPPRLERGEDEGERPRERQPVERQERPFS